MRTALTTVDLREISTVEHFAQRVDAFCDIDVAWGEMDSLGHINNAYTFRYFETARIHYLTQADFFRELDKLGLGPILAATSARYLKPVVYPDRLVVSSSLVECDARKMTIQHLAFSTAQQRVVTMGVAEVVLFDYKTQQAAPVPDTVLARVTTSQ